MSQTMVDAFDALMRAARAQETSLAEKLRFISASVRSTSEIFADSIDAFVARLESAGVGAEAPKVGDPMPDFVLADQDGHLVRLTNLLKEGPVAIVFHRGHWCPYCRVTTASLAEVQDEIKPVQIVTISPETQQFTRMIRAEAGAHFPFLTDFGNGYALLLNMTIWVDDQMSALIAAAGWDIPSYQGHDGWFLPIPAVFIVGQDGLIKVRHVKADYRQRMEPADLRDAAQAAFA